MVQSLSAASGSAAMVSPQRVQARLTLGGEVRASHRVFYAGVVFLVIGLFAFGCGTASTTSSTAVSTPAVVTQTAPAASTTTTSSVAAPTASLHYKNATFGFEFDYPKAWRFSEEPSPEDFVLLVASAGLDSQTYAGVYV